MAFVFSSSILLSPVHCQYHTSFVLCICHTNHFKVLMHETLMCSASFSSWNSFPQPLHSCNYNGKFCRIYYIILAPSFKTIQMTHSYQKKPQNIVSNHKVAREKPLNFELVSVFYRFDLGVRKLCLHAHWKRCRSKPFSIAFRLATPFTIHFVRNCRNFAFFIRFVFARLEFFAQAFHEF